jgi:hypothetical protein
MVATKIAMTDNAAVLIDDSGRQFAVLSEVGWAFYRSAVQAIGQINSRL